MGRASYKIRIDAPREKVFDFIADVEGFSKYSSLVKSIKKLPSGLYLWTIKVFGITLRWEAEVITSERPSRFAWKSIKGVKNSGSYILKEAPGGTFVELEMSYSLAENPLVNALVSPIESLMATRVYKEFMSRVKETTERGG